MSVLQLDIRLSYPKRLSCLNTGSTSVLIYWGHTEVKAGNVYLLVPNRTSGVCICSVPING